MIAQRVGNNHHHKKIWCPKKLDESGAGPKIKEVPEMAFLKVINYAFSLILEQKLYLLPTTPLKIFAISTCVYFRKIWETFSLLKTFSVTIF